jgi:hypothetical protein
MDALAAVARLLDMAVGDSALIADPLGVSVATAVWLTPARGPCLCPHCGQVRR